MAAGADRASEISRLVADNDVRFIRLWFTDILGRLKSFSITASELDRALELEGHLAPRIRALVEGLRKQ